MMYPYMKFEDETEVTFVLQNAGRGRSCNRCGLCSDEAWLVFGTGAACVRKEWRVLPTGGRILFFRLFFR